MKLFPVLPNCELRQQNKLVKNRDPGARISGFELRICQKIVMALC